MVQLDIEYNAAYVQSDQEVGCYRWRTALAYKTTKNMDSVRSMFLQCKSSAKANVHKDALKSRTTNKFETVKASREVSVR